MTADERDDLRPIHDGVARLLRLAGPRPVAPPRLEHEVRAAVHAHWRAKVTARRRRRWTLAAAAVVLAVLGAGWWRSVAPVEGGPAAVLESSLGEVRAPGMTVAIGETIATGETGLAALRPVHGTGSVRLDRSTRLRWVAATALELESGAVYVDTHGEGSGLEIRTRFGTVREVGTQFEVRIDDALRLRVREGTVLLELDDFLESDDFLEVGEVATWEAGAGEELHWRPESGVERGRVALHGAPWAWTMAAAPPFDLEGRSLGDVLARLARETGWTVRYADEPTRRAYEDSVIHGSPRGLRADQVPERVLPAFGLAFTLDAGVLVVEEEQP